MNDLMEVSAVARRLNVSAMTVYRLIKKKKLKSINVGVSKGIRVNRGSLEKFEHDRRNNDE